jgi:hypothetical protein
MYFSDWSVVAVGVLEHNSGTTVPIENMPFFVGYHDQFELVAAGIGNPEDIYTNDFGGYTPCVPGNGLEAPTLNAFPISSNGQLALSDRFGGVGRNTTLVFMRPEYSPGCTGIPNLNVLIVLGWSEPGRWENDPVGLPSFKANFSPGDTFDEVVTVDTAPTQQITVTVNRKVVEWVSSDASGTSPGYADSADLVALATELGSEVYYGHNDDPPIPGSSPVAYKSNFHVNWNPFEGSSNLIDSGDVTAWSAASGGACLVSKAAESEFARILDWWGIQKTGQLIVCGPNGETCDGYAMVDEAKRLRGIADPYGYRNVTAAATATSVPWSTVKRLYR